MVQVIALSAEQVAGIGEIGDIKIGEEQTLHQEEWEASAIKAALEDIIEKEIDLRSGVQISLTDNGVQIAPWNLKDYPSHRFTIGTKVVCRTGKDEWSKGRIIALDYRGADWPEGTVVPYQVELLDGTLIFVPRDVPELCKELVPPSWEQAVIDQDMQKLEAAIILNGCDETDYVGRTPLLSCVGIGWQEGASFLLTQTADPCKGVGRRKCSAIHLAVLPLGRVVFQDEDMDSVIFSREDGVINAKLEKNGSPGEDIDDDNVTSISYLECDGKLTWVSNPSEGESWSILPPPLRAWVPARLATLVHGTAVQTAGLPKAASKLPLVQALLQARADVNAQNEDPDNDVDNFVSTTYKGLEQRQHRSALHYAAEAGEVGLCSTLIAARAAVDLEDRFKMTPLDLALEEGSEQTQLVADVLLHCAADPNRGNMCRGLQQTTLHQMSDLGNAKLLELLIKHGGKVNGVGKQGMTPLHLAARKKHAEVVEVLLQASADINLLDSSGRTPWHYALSNKSSEVAKALARDDNLQLPDRITLLESAKAKIR